MIPLLLAGIGALFLLVNAPQVTLFFGLAALLVVIAEPTEVQE